MAKIFMYVFLLGGISLLAAMAGIGTFSNQILGAIGIIDTTTWVANPNFQDGAFFTKMSLLIGAASVVTAIVIGYLTRSSQESSMVAAYILTSGLFGWIAGDIGSLIVYAGTQNEIVKFVSWLILVPMLGAYIVAMVQWWRGNDI